MYVTVLYFMFTNHQVTKSDIRQLITPIVTVVYGLRCAEV